MSKANIQISPLQYNEIDSFINLYCTAFTDPQADMIMPMMYPMGLHSPLVHKRLRTGFERTYNQHQNTHYLAKDPSTGDILGISWWQVVDEEPSSQQQAPDLPDVPGMNLQLAKAYAEISSAFRREQIKPPFVELRMLAVHPDHQGRGVGSMLLRHGLEMADEMKLRVFVVSAVQGKPLYERYGFGDVKLFPLDCRDYGGVREGRHWSLIRPART